MPSSITHYLFAQQSLDIVSKKLPFLLDYIFAVNLGTQGPDPLFFYGSIPWKKRKDKAIASKLGSYLHSNDIVEKFSKMLNYAAAQNQTIKPLLFSYIFGHGLHYLLDREAHAYVFYETGFDADGNLTGKYATDHALFESMIDLEFPKYLGIKPYAIKPHKTLNLEIPDAIEISKMYAANETIDDLMFFYAWQDMKYLLEFLLDETKFKQKILKVLKMKNSIMYSMIHKIDKDKDDKIDYLNLNKNEWRNPNTNKIHTESFIDLFKIALSNLPQWAEIISQAYKNEEFISKLKDFCNNRGYDGIDIKTKMLYHKSVYLKGE